MVDIIRRNRLALQNVKFAKFIVRRYYSFVNEQEEIRQAAYVGLIQAAELYDARKGRFTTLAIQYILWSIKRTLKARQKYVGGISMDKEFNEINFADNPSSLHEVIPDSTVDIEGDTDRREKLALLRQAWAGLREQHRRVLVLAFGLDGREPLTMEEIAQGMRKRISREGVRQIRENALKRLRARMSQMQIQRRAIAA